MTYIESKGGRRGAGDMVYIPLVLVIAHVCVLSVGWWPVRRGYIGYYWFFPLEERTTAVSAYHDSSPSVFIHFYPESSDCYQSAFACRDFSFHVGSVMCRYVILYNHWILNVGLLVACGLLLVVVVVS